MSRKQFLALLLFYLSYLFFGASVYYTLEQESETADRALKLQNRLDIHAYLLRNLQEQPHNESRVDQILQRVSDYCMYPVTHPATDVHEAPHVWTYYHAFFFSFTVISTVGYGNISPSTTFGRMFMLIYAIIGLPANAIMFANLGDIFGQTFERMYSKYKEYKLSVNKNYVALRMSLIGQVFLYLVPGMLVFIFLPAVVFTYFEKWPYEISVYYAFVTLTTIGFGDYAATFQPSQPHEFGNLFVAYEIFIIVWFIFGLGYLVMIMGYLIKAYKSKHIQKLENQLSLGLKDAHNRIWNGVTSDVNYLRKILNEISFARFKPIYVDEDERTVGFGAQKSASCPDLTLYRLDEDCFRPQRYVRHMSECYGVQEAEQMRARTGSVVSMLRTQSDTDLSRFDRKKTFAGMTDVEPNDLLAKVASALGNLQMAPSEGDTQSEGGGVHCFSDSQILANERTWSGWSNVSNTTTAQQPSKMRANSEIKIAIDDPENNCYEWTWSGANNQINDLRNLRKKSKYNDLYRASFNTEKARKATTTNGVTIIPIPPSAETSITSGQNRFIGRFNIFRKRTSSTSSNLRQQLPSNIHEDAIKYIQATQQQKTSYQPPPDNRYLAASHLEVAGQRSRRGSIFETLQNENSQVLENTTIADLIFALEAIHTKANIPDNLPRRKMGTASMTPPEIPSLFSLFEPQSSSTYETYNPTSVSRRGSLFPMPHAAAGSRRQSMFPAISATNRRASIMMPVHSATVTPKPPPYSYLDVPTPSAARRRFSVHPAAPPQITYTSPHSSQMSLASNASSLQVPPVTRKLSLRPSPLARASNASFRDSSRYSKAKSLQREVVNQNARRRHDSLSNLNDQHNSGNSGSSKK